MTLDARFIKGDTNRLQESTIVDPRFPRSVQRLRKSCCKDGRNPRHAHPTFVTYARGAATVPPRRSLRGSGRWCLQFRDGVFKFLNSKYETLDFPDTRSVSNLLGSAGVGRAGWRQGAQDF